MLKAFGFWPDHSQLRPCTRKGVEVGIVSLEFGGVPREYVDTDIMRHVCT